MTCLPSNFFLAVFVSSKIKVLSVICSLTLVDNKFKGGEVAMFDISNGGVGYEKTDLIPQDVVNFVESKIKK